MQDNRMGWIRFLETPVKARDPRWVEDWEIASECRITGKLEVADGKLIFSPHSFEPDENGLYKYVIRFSYPLAVQDAKEVVRRSEAATRKGYHFGPPPVKWSDLRYKSERRTEDAEQATHA